MEQFFKNFSQSTITGAMTNSQTTLTVADATKFPTSPDFRVLIDNELMKVTGVSGTTFTITRGDGGTTATAHSSSAPIYGVLTKEALDAIRSDGVTGGSAGATFNTNWPGSTLSAGRIFIPNDAPWISTDDGSGAVYFGVPQYRRIYPPDNSLFSWRNQGSATVSTTGGRIYLNDPAHSGDQCRVREKGIPQSPPWSVEIMAFADIYPGAAFLNAGVVAIDSVSGRMSCMRIFTNSTPATYLIAGNWNSVTSYNGDLALFQLQLLGVMPVHWFKIRDDGTNIAFSYSLDGYNWRVLASQGRTAFLTNGADKIGFYADAVHATLYAAITVISWKEGT